MDLYTYFGTYIFAIIINFTNCQECVLNPSWPSEVPFEKRLKDELIKDYDVSTSPKSNNTRGVEVSVFYGIERLEFDELEEGLTIYAWNMFEWEDDRLKWGVDKHKGIKTVVLNYYDIWSPQIEVKNFKDENGMTFIPDIYECLANNTGHVKCIQLNIHTLVCSSEMKDWPYDRKLCILKIDDITWSQDKSDVVFTDIDLFPLVPSFTAWKIVYSKEHINLTGDHQASIELVLERVAEGLEASIVVPAVVISVLTMTSTLLGVKDIMRLGISCVSLFSHFLFLTAVSKNIPKHSVDAPYILLFISGSMTLTLLVIVMSILLRYLCSRKYTPPVLITSFNTLILDGLGQYLVFPRWSVTSNNKTVLDSIKQQTEWLDFSNIINSIVFIVCVITYIAMYSIYLSHQEYVPPID